MSIAEQVSRIRGEKSKIAIKLSTMGLVEQNADLETLADAIEGIPDKGAITATVRQGESYTIPKGYHNGGGTVTGLDNPEADATKYMLQAKTVTPTKSQIPVSPDQGYYGLSSVTVNPIPTAYQDVTQVNAAKSDVLAGKKIVAADGTVLVGEMRNNGAKVLFLGRADDDDNWIRTQAITEGYHDGNGYAQIYTDEKEVTPDKTTQTIKPDVGMVLKRVTVNPIPDNYVDTSDANAEAANILQGKTAYVNGEKITGTMPLKGSHTALINLTSGSESMELSPGYYSYLKVGITDDLEAELAAI